MSGPTQRRVRGFTLMEMMVVLVLISLTTALLFEALGSFRQANARIAARTADQRESALALAWLQDSVAGLRADREQPFEGDREQLSGLSLSPLGGGAGAPASIVWRLDERSLHYRQGEAAALTITLTGFRGFGYLDAEGKPHSQWPPGKGLHPELPAAVLLVFQDAAGREFQRPVAITGPHQWRPTPYEMEMD